MLVGMAKKSSPSRAAAAVNPADTTSAVAGFEAALQQLEHLVEQMERGEMTLEESLAAYERGVGLYRNCQQALEQAELRVRLLDNPEQPERAVPFPALPDITPAPDDA